VRKRGSLVVLAAVAALVAVLVWWDRRRPTTDESARERQHLVPGFDRARATELAIERRGVTTRLRHEASGWWIVGPPRRRADDGAVESLLGVLEFGTVERRIADVDGALAAKLGLQNPRVIVRVEGHVLRVGGDDPSRGVYVTRDDEPGALVVEHRLIETADLDPRLWMSMRLTLSSPSEARKVAFGWTLERQAGGWRVTEPVNVRAVDAKVDALLQALERARALHAESSDARLDGSVALAFDGQLQAHFLDDKARRADDALLTFRKSDLNLLFAPVAVFYERRLFPLRLDDLVAAELGPLVLRREAGVWRIVAPLAAAGPARDEAVRALLEPLLAAEARSFSPTAPAAGAARVRLATRDDDISAVIDGAHARRSGDTLTLELAAPLDLRFDTKRLGGAAADLGATAF
jgi:uncharacterized protein DUF4340